MPRAATSVRNLSYLLAFIFGGAIVGETVALSMVIATVGSEAVSRLYLLNGFLLFLLPALFFGNIDRANRGRLLSWLLGVCTILLVAILVLLRIPGSERTSRLSVILVGMVYPFSYLSKTILFLTFWTLANDVFHTGEAKRGFPRIAGWGFVGGLAGALLARWLLVVAEANMLLAVWAGSYGAALVLSFRITRTHHRKLLQREDASVEAGERGGLLRGLSEVMSIELVRLIAILYFLVFVAVFSVDFLFWRSCHQWFGTSRSLAAFQFTFYLVHGVATVSGLWFVMPASIARFGFVRIFSVLPCTLLVGATTVLAAQSFGFGARATFGVLIAVQFVRYVAFETAFSPIYQMFFAVVTREKRGRAKTVLDGLVKPAAIILAGIVVMVAGRNPHGIPVVVAAVSAVMVYVVARVRTGYMRELVPDLSSESAPNEVIEQIASHYDQKILSLIREYSHSNDADLRGLAVKILAHLGSRQALRTIAEMYRSERDQGVREMVARSLTNFHWYEARGFVEELLRDTNPRIRGNVIQSLNNMASNWKWRLRIAVKPLLFDGSMRVRLAAAQYLWQSGERAEQGNVRALLTHLLESTNSNKRSAGLYLVSVLKPDGWEGLALDHLRSTSFQVYQKCVETIMGSASRGTQIAALSVIEGLGREHIAEAGRIVQRIGGPAIPSVVDFLRTARSRRMVYEMVHSVRVVRDAGRRRKGVARLPKDTAETLLAWIFADLEGVYRDAVVLEGLSWAQWGRTAKGLMEDALRERLFRTGEWALDVLSLVESQGLVALGRRDLDLSDPSQRSDMVEIVESAGHKMLGAAIVPILEFESWRAVARAGKAQFGSPRDGTVGGLEHFAESGNKWVCLCALYCVAHSPERERLVAAHRATIARLAVDPYRYLADGAIGLLGENAREDTVPLDTFRLLETVLFFKKTPLFRNVSAEKLMGLAEISRLVSHAKGTVVSKEGDISEQLYIVRNGSLKIVKMKSQVKTILTIVRRGETYGEIGLFNQAPRSASAVANEDCEVFVVQRGALKKLLMDIPEIAYNFLEVFSEKLRRSGEEVALLHTTLSSRIKDEHTAVDSKH